MEQDLKIVMLILENLEMEVLIKKRFQEFYFDSYMREFHLCKTVFKFIQLAQLKLLCGYRKAI